MHERRPHDPARKLSTAKRVAVVRGLVEGCSIRATVRMTGVANNTVTNLLVDLGAACAAYQSKALVNLPCKRLQCDENLVVRRREGHELVGGIEGAGRGGTMAEFAG